MASLSSYLWLILKVFWLFLPAMVANTAPVFANHLFPRMNTPIDCRVRLYGIRILGDNKTFRGLVAGLLAGMLIFGMQKVLFNTQPFFRELSAMDYRAHSVLAGALIGGGALCGDLVKSFFKRRLEIPPGRNWFPFDQIDWVLGASAAMCFMIPLKGSEFLMILVLGFSLHVASNFIGYYLGLRKTLF